MKDNHTTLFVRAFSSNLDENARRNLIVELFKDFINISPDEVNLIPNREFGGFKNFCFVDVPNEMVNDIIAALNGQTLLDDTELVVNVAQPKEERPAGSNSRGGGFGNKPFNKNGNSGGRNFDRGGSSSSRDSSYSGGNSRGGGSRY